MNIHADTMTETMAEFFTITSIYDHLARCRIDLCARSLTGFHRRDTCGLRLHHQIIDFLEFARPVRRTTPCARKS